MINIENNCITLHKSSGIAWIKHYYEVQGMEIFKNIIDTSTNQDVVDLASRTFVDYHLYIVNDDIDGKQ